MHNPPTRGSTPIRRVRSYVRREGRITRAQRRALETLWPRYGLDAAADPLDLERIFGRAAPTVLEVGFGNGDGLAQLARAHPEKDFLGVEVHRPGIGHLLLRLEAEAIGNVRVLAADATDVLEHRLRDDTLDEVYVFFPDPWVKKRHHKRRLIQLRFADLVRRRLTLGGRLHLATDWEDYARHMMAVMEAAPGFRNTAGAGRFAADRDPRPPTRFEARGLRLGHRVWDLVFQRTG